MGRLIKLGALLGLVVLLAMPARAAWEGPRKLYNIVRLTFAPPTSDQARANDSAVTVERILTRVAGDGAAKVLDTDPAIADGVRDGQLLIIQGTSDSNTVQIADDKNVQLAGGSAITLGKGDMLFLVWDAGDGDWYELGRADN